MIQAHALLFKNSPELYYKMGRVLAHSMRENSLGTPLVIHEISETDADICEIGQKHERQPWFIANTRKTRHLTRLVRDAAEGELLLLLDIDTMVIGDVGVIEQGESFDLALTTGRENRYKLNTGVVFIRATCETKQLCAAWELRAMEMLADKALHDKWRPKWGGINQSSLASLIEQPGWLHGIRLRWLQTREWNAISADHRHAIRRGDERRAKIVHLLGALRRVADVNKWPRYNQLRYVGELWQRYELESRV